MLKSFDSELQVIIYGCLQAGQNIEKLSFLFGMIYETNLSLKSDLQNID